MEDLERALRSYAIRRGTRFAVDFVNRTAHSYFHRRAVARVRSATPTPMPGPHRSRSRFPDRRRRRRTRVFRRRRPRPKFARAPRRTGGGRHVRQIRSGKRPSMPLKLGMFLNWKKDLIGFKMTHTETALNPVVIRLNNPCKETANIMLSGTTANFTLGGDPYTSTVLTGVNKVFLKYVYIKGAMSFTNDATPAFWMTCTVYRTRLPSGVVGQLESSPFKPKAGSKDFRILKRITFSPGTTDDVTGAEEHRIRQYAFAIPINRWFYTKNHNNAVADVGWVDDDPNAGIFLSWEAHNFDGAAGVSTVVINNFFMKRLYSFLPFSTSAA